MVALGLASAQPIQADRTGWPQSVTFATIPTEGTGDATQRFQPMVDILKERLGINVVFRNGADYAAVILAMQNKQVDIGYFGTASYLDAEDRAGAEAFVRDDAVTTGLGYHSLIISKADGTIKKFEDAKGKDFAFVDPASTSGFRVPMFSFCAKLKIEPSQYFGKVQFAGNHENVILGVARGNIPVGATNDLSLAQAVDKGAVKMSDLTILYKSDVIPGSPIAYRKDLPQSLKNAIKQVFLELQNQPAGKTFLDGLNLKRYVETKPADYQDFRQINTRYREATCPK